MKHKKLKIFIFIILLFLLIVMIFGSCKKTNAYSYDYNEPFIEDNHTLLYGESFAYIFNTDIQLGDIFALTLRQGNTAVYAVELVRSNNNLSVYVYNRQGNTEISRNITNISNTKLFYIQYLFDYVDEKIYLYFNTINFTITNRQDESPIITAVNLSNDPIIMEINDTAFKADYLSQQSTINYSLYYSNFPNAKIKGLQQLYKYNIFDNQLSNDIDEQNEFIFDDIKNDVPINYYNYLIDYYYTQGYTAGYNKGYLEGETAGYNRGFSEGYNEGYQDGQEDTQLYQNGYTAGYNAGYSDGEMSTDAYTNGYTAGYDEGERNGYQRGYNTGYNYGYEQGQTGDNPITPAFSVISSIFGGVGSVLAIQLVPGVPLGLFFLVPLFFAVLGLILWIWRRN